MRHSRAFTLLEVMVVLAIIGALMALATLNSSDRQAQDETEQFGRQLMALFSAYRQEAVFQNLDLGLAMDDQSLLLLNYQDINTQEYSTDKTREELDQLVKNPWQPYSGTLIHELTVPDSVDVSLEVDGQKVDFSEFMDDDDGPKPVLLFLSSDEYTPYQLILTHEQDERFDITLSGDGFSEPLLTLERFDE